MVNPNRDVPPRRCGKTAISIAVLVTVSLLTLPRGFETIARTQAPLRGEEKTIGARTSPPVYSSSFSLDHDIRRADDDESKRRELPSNQVFVTGPWVPETIIAHNLKLNPHLEFHVYNYSTVARSVMLIDRQLKEEANVKGAWDSWKALRSWAFRADLWRCMVLWSEGGIYMDSKMRFTTPIDVWAGLSPDETLSACSDSRLKFKSQTLGRDVEVMANGLLSARKGSPVLLEAIRLIIRNVERRSYFIPGEEAGLRATGHMDLSVTGPYLLSYAAARVDHVNLQRNVPGKSVRMECDILGKQIFMRGAGGEGMRIAGLDKSEHTMVHENGNDFSALYKQRLVYCDETMPDMRQGDALPCKLEEFLPELAEVEIPSKTTSNNIV